MSTQPNILFLFSDQHRADCLGCAGHAHVKTPNLDRLADEGVHFTGAYCATPLCFPSRISLATGRFPHNTGHNTNNEGFLYPDTPMISHAFRDAGYRTAHLGKLHLAQCEKAGDPACEAWCHEAGWDDAMPIYGKAWSCAYEEDEYDAYLRWLATAGKLEAFQQDYRERCFGWKYPDVSPRPRGYAAPSVLEPEEHQDGFITRSACEWLKTVSDDQPWFCWVNWGGPHDPWDAPGRFGTMYDPAEMGPPIADDLENAPQKLHRHAHAHGLWKSGLMAPDQWRKIMAQYYGSISFIDDGIGQILDTLEARGMLENTIVVYSSDHGEMMFDHNMLTKWVMYEASSKVPLIVRLPGGERRAIDAPVSLLDLVPTLLDLAGVDRESMPVLHGESLAPALKGEAADGTRAVFCEMDKTKMIRKGPWKFVTDPEFEFDQLFHLEDDPEELTNLALDPGQRERCEELRREILHWMINTQNAPRPRGKTE
ncbi:MAG: sulfatase family protein [Planctomycetota bacterium]|jgi:choline-sulfatase